MGRDFLYRLASLFRRRALDRELDHELRFHIEKQAEKHERRGLGRAEALRQARLEFGGMDRFAEECREARGVHLLETLWSDFKYGLRTLRRTPFFAAAICAVLGLGIGVNIALFQFLNAVTLRPLAVKDPDSLVRFWRKSPDRTNSGLPYPAAQFLRDHNDVLSATLLRAQAEVAWGEEGEDVILALFVSTNWFDELGYAAAHGRLLSETADSQAEDVPSIVVSHRFWTSRLHGAMDAIGSIARINGLPARIVGVVPAEFPTHEFENPQVWVAIDRLDHFNPGMGLGNQWSRNNVAMYGRLRDGLSPAAAREGMRVAVQALARERPDAFGQDEWLEPLSGSLRFLPPEERRDIRLQALLMGGLTFLVFSVACANVCSLVLSRAVSRYREFGIRSSLGAGRWRVIGCMVGESALLAGVGTTTGVLLGYAAAELLGSLPGVPPLDLAPDWRTLLAAAAFAFLAVLAAGVLPGWIVSRQPGLGLVLKDGGLQVSSGPQRRRFNQALVAIQVAGSCVLLVVAALFVSNLARILQSGPGFEIERVALMEEALSQYGIRGGAARAYWDEVKSSLESHPQTAAVALVSQVPFAGIAPNSEYPDAPGLTISVLRVEPAFFRVMGIRIVAGRAFESADVPGEAVMISRRLATRMYGTLDVVGRRYPKTGGERTIVGVTEDAPIVRYPERGGAEQYTPFTASYFEGGPGSTANPVLLVRAEDDPSLLLAPMRQAARQAASKVLPRVRLLESALQERLSPYRAAGLLLFVVSQMALLLACLGVFGLTAYGVTLRTREMGIRIALGADRPAIVSEFLRRLAKPVFWGAVAGSVAAFAAAKVLESEPLHLDRMDLRAYAAAVLVLFLSAAAAASVPVILALRSDPLRSLRQD